MIALIVEANRITLSPAFIGSISGLDLEVLDGKTTIPICSEKNFHLISFRDFFESFGSLRLLYYVLYVY